MEKLILKFRLILCKLKFLALFSLLFLACAIQSAPSGGPADEIPPIILSTIPSSGDTNVTRDTKIEIQFSEGMDRISVETSFFISPLLTLQPSFKWKGDKLVIQTDSLLAANVTYVITIGTEATDLRKNGLKESYSLAFSTGQALDSGMIEGQVYNQETPEGTLIWAYQSDSRASGNPLDGSGDYITQTDDNGSFTLPFLRDGYYTLFAIVDQNGDNIYTASVDLVGIPSFGGSIKNGSKLQDVFLSPVMYDSLAPQLYTIESTTENRVNLMFSKPLLPSTGKRENFSIIDIATGSKIPDAVSSLFFLDKRNSEVALIVENLLPGTDYSLNVKHLSDMFLNELASTNDSLSHFTLSEIPDTTKFELISIAPADSSTNIPVFQVITLQFSEPIDTFTLSNAITLLDSSENQLQFSIAEVTNRHLSLSFTELPLAPETRYSVSLDPKQLKSISGKMFESESTHTTQFTTGDGRDNGEIIGSVTIDSTLVSIPIYLTLKNADKKIEILQMTEPDGSFRFRGIPAGSYSLSLFVDLNSNGVWFPGSLRPFRFSEPIFVLPSEIAVRSGFDNILTPIKLSIH